MQIKYTNGIGWGSNMLKSSQEKLQRQAAVSYTHLRYGTWMFYEQYAAPSGDCT